jgi:hypothetical protein
LYVYSFGYAGLFIQVFVWNSEQEKYFKKEMWQEFGHKVNNQKLNDL